MPLRSFKAVRRTPAWWLASLADQSVTPLSRTSLVGALRTTHLSVLEPALRISARFTAQSLSTVARRCTLPNRADSAHALDERPTHTAADEDRSDFGSGVERACDDRAAHQGWRQCVSAQFLARRPGNTR